MTEGRRIGPGRGGGEWENTQGAAGGAKIIVMPTHLASAEPGRGGGAGPGVGTSGRVWRCGEERGRGAAGSGARGMRGGRAAAAQCRGAGLGDGR